MPDLLHRDGEGACTCNLLGTAADGPGAVEHLWLAKCEIKGSKLPRLTEGFLFGLCSCKSVSYNVICLRPPKCALQFDG